MNWLIAGSLVMGFLTLIGVVFGPAVLGAVVMAVIVGIFVWAFCRKSD